MVVVQEVMMMSGEVGLVVKVQIGKVYSLNPFVLSELESRSRLVFVEVEVESVMSQSHVRM